MSCMSSAPAFAINLHYGSGRKLLIDCGEISVIADEETVSSLDDEGNLLCRAADEISTDVSLSDDVLALLIEQYGHRQATELILCISYFNMLCRFVESTRVELEEENVL